MFDTAMDARDAFYLARHKFVRTITIDDLGISARGRGTGLPGTLGLRGVSGDLPEWSPRAAAPRMAVPSLTPRAITPASAAERSCSARAPSSTRGSAGRASV